MGALAFVNAETVMPVVLRDLGGPDWVIALMPMSILLGFSIFPLLAAHRIERLGQLKPFILPFGLVQRVPFLAAGCVLLIWGEDHPMLTVVLVASAPFLSGCFGGIMIGAYSQFIARIIPPERLASAWALRFIIGAVIGIAAGEVIEITIRTCPGTRGFGVLHLVAAGLMFLSFAAFLLMREVRPEEPRRAEAPTFTGNLRHILAILRTDRAYRGYLMASVGGSGVFILLPFLSLHVLRVTEQPASYVGSLVMAQMLGGILGNIGAGYLGDRVGGRMPVVLAQVLFVVICGSLLFITTPAVFEGLYFVLGMALYMNRVGLQTLNIELAPSGKLPTYVATASVVNVPSFLTAAAVGATLHTVSNDIVLPSLAALLWILLGALGMVGMTEPRRRRRSSL